jgi:hypothetical protein
MAPSLFPDLQGCASCAELAEIARQGPAQAALPGCLDKTLVR